MVSLGLGILYEKSRDQPRRLKQLAMLLGIADYLRSTSTPEIIVYAQDPNFTKADETRLRSLGVQVLKTSSPSDLGEAGRVIDERTLVYSPFLTVAAHELLLKTSAMDLLVGDDFNALRSKWEKLRDNDEREFLVIWRYSGYCLATTKNAFERQTLLVIARLVASWCSFSAGSSSDAVLVAVSLSCAASLEDSPDHPPNHGEDESDKNRDENYAGDSPPFKGIAGAAVVVINISASAAASAASPSTTAAASIATTTAAAAVTFATSSAPSTTSAFVNLSNDSG
ncbi:uncharacterized protein PG986_005559 [Apiospora aurea]|uniref:SRR1-like domain-containing protein n=1 Tax=Apiospora aurea TaxID=335848 RepID=A0ABR1QIQ7_9PEZI